VFEINFGGGSICTQPLTTLKVFTHSLYFYPFIYYSLVKHMNVINLWNSKFSDWVLYMYFLIYVFVQTELIELFLQDKRCSTKYYLISSIIHLTYLLLHKHNSLSKSLKNSSDQGVCSNFKPAILHLLHQECDFFVGLILISWCRRSAQDYFLFLMLIMCLF
jgi:hypothetical protein